MFLIKSIASDDDIRFGYVNYKLVSNSVAIYMKRMSKNNKTRKMVKRLTDCHFYSPHT